MKRVTSVVALALFCTVLLTSLPALAAQVVKLDSGNEPCSVELISSDLATTVLRVQVNHFLQDEVDIAGQAYSIFSLGMRPLRLDAGSPDLPTVRESIRIPGDAGMVARVIDVEYQDFADIDVAPSKGSLTRDVDPATVDYAFGDTYGRDAWYPSEVAALGEPYILRDTRGLVVEVNPMRYNPATRTLRVYTSVTVEVTAAGPGETNVLFDRPEKRVREFEAVYESHYLNNDADPFKYSSVPEVGPMLVVTYDAFNANVQPLVDWKNQMGVPTTLVNMSSVGASANDLMTYIQNAYDNDGIAFVLLVGDGAQIPYLSNDGAAADPMYSLVAGGDSYPDLFVGRMSATNPTEVATQIERSIEYERDPQVGADWYHKASGVASNDSGSTGTPDWQRIDSMRDQLLTYNYTLIDQIYDPGASSSAVAAALNEGRSLVNYMGHGVSTGWSTTGFSNSDVNSLTNDNMLPWIISVACNTGQYHNTTCFAEAWMRATNGGEPSGAAGIYASTVSMQWMPPVAAQHEIVDLLIADAKRTLGGLCFNGSCQMIDEYGSNGITEFKNWTLFGDPSLRVRTDTPAATTVSHGGVVVPVLPTFTVNTDPGAIAGLSAGGVYHGSAIADASGVAEIALVGDLPYGGVTLTVTAVNGIPHVETIPVGGLEVPTCDVTPAAINVTLQQDTQGTEHLYLANNGEDGSTLYYSINVFDPDYPTKAGDKSLTGSYVEAGIAEYMPGETLDVQFLFHNNSTDVEWVVQADLDFPAGVVVNSATDINDGSHTIPYGGATGDGVTASWVGSSWSQYIDDNTTGTASVNLSFTGIAGDVVIPWTLIGDEWGSDPHQVSGEIVITMAGPNVQIAQPNGGEIWAIGTQQEILFNGGGGPENLMIELDRGDGVWELIAENVPLSAGSYLWDVTGPISAHCMMRVTDMLDPEITDTSAGEFTIYRTMDWIALDSYMGTVDKGAAADILVSFDATGLPLGTYRAEIVITSNAGDPVIVPVEMVVDGGLAAIGDTPRTVALLGNSPNPFNPKTSISFALPANGPVALDVYDVSGRLVRTLVRRDMTAGTHQLEWNGRDDAGRMVSTGVYFYRLQAGNVTLSDKMLLVK